MANRIDYRKFEDVFRKGEHFPYDQHVCRDIDAKRKSLGGVLFVDRVFTALGITKTKLYPPRDFRSLQDLHQHILNSKMSVHHKVSAIYYLLLDHDDGINARTKLAETFVQHTGMPKRYEIFMNGLWNMDRLQFPVAVEYLAHPSLLPEFADNIVTVLVRHAQNNDYSLVLAYYYAVQPVLKTQDALELLFDAIACTDVAGAFSFTRKFPTPARRLLFEQLIVSVLKGAPEIGPGTGTGGGGDVAARSAELVSLPLSDDEDVWLRTFLTVGEGRKLKHAKDTIIMKKIVSGDLGLGEGKLPHGPWGMVLQGFKQDVRSGRAEQ